MKKNVMLKIAAVLLVAVLLSTCAISATFAKYVSETDSDSATARVAKWGMTVDTVATSKFAKVYASGSGTVNATAEVVAPGTKGDLVFTSTVSGVNETEVSARVIYVCEVTYEGFEIDGAKYMPIKFYVNGDTENAYTLDTLGAAVSQYKSAIIAADATANAVDTITISWAWDFETSNDDEDTALGSNAEDNTFTITLTAQVVQTGENYAVAA